MSLLKTVEKLKSEEDVKGEVDGYQVFLRSTLSNLMKYIYDVFLPLEEKKYVTIGTKMKEDVIEEIDIAMPKGIYIMASIDQPSFNRENSVSDGCVSIVISRDAKSAGTASIEVSLKKVKNEYKVTYHYFDYTGIFLKDFTLEALPDVLDSWINKYV